VSLVLLCSFAGGVEPFLPPLEEPVGCEFCVGAPLYHMFSFTFMHSCFWQSICNMMYRHLCILGSMHFVSYAFDRKSFSYIHCSP
jgi:hypothetical protein